MHRLTPVLALAVFLAAVFLAPTSSASPTPAPTPANSATINRALNLMGGNIACSNMPVAVNNLSARAVDVVSESMAWAREVSNPMLDEAIRIAWVLLWAVLFAEISFTGIRLMLGSSIVEQLGLLTTKTFIYLIVSGSVIFPGAPSPWNSSEGIIRSTMYRLMHAGKVVGGQMVKSASHTNVQNLPGIVAMNPDPNLIPGPSGSGALGPDNVMWGPAVPVTSAHGRAEPIMYWMSWLGIDNACRYTFDSRGRPMIDGRTNAVVDPSNEYKYSQASLNARLWGESATINNPNNASQRVYKSMEDNLPELEKMTGTGASGSGTEGGITDLARGVLIAMMPLQMFGIAMSVAGIQIGSLVTVVFAQMSILVGAITAFNIASALGLAVLPLMYFRMFDKIWSQYLIGLGSLGLVPCFFYILSAIGFVFSTTIFEMLFPLTTTGPAGSSKPLALVLNEVFFAAVRNTMSSFSLVTNVFGGLFETTIGWLLIIYLSLGRIMFGSTVVAAFITGGAMFALLAPRFAFRWTAGFGGEDVVEKISEVFNGIQSAVGSGLGQMYSDALSRAGSLGSGIGKGLRT